MASQSPFKYTNKLQGRRVLVLGGSTGIGFCVAEAAVEHGAFVTISSSNQTKLDKAVARLQSHAKAVGVSPSNITAKTCDLANEDTLDRNVIDLLEFATRDGKLDHVAFSAGDALVLPALGEVTVDQLRKGGAVRMYGSIFLAKHLPKYIHQSVESSFTLTGGSASWRPTKAFAIIAGYGAGIEGLARGFAVALKPVRVNTVQPGAVHTELFGGIPEANLAAVLESFKKESITGTVGRPEEVAEAYMYLMKDSFATGGVVESNGGRLVGDLKDEFQFN
jgi:NAD(P)-dependent dehydrogenase (short-subunit alcohol dehydrogenase family)